ALKNFLQHQKLLLADSYREEHLGRNNYTTAFLPTTTTPESEILKRCASRSRSTPIIAPSLITPFLSILARRTTASFLTRILGRSTEPSTVAPSATCTSDDKIELRTVPPDTMQPGATIEPCAIPFCTNFAGGKFCVSVE